MRGGFTALVPGKGDIGIDLILDAFNYFLYR